MFMHQQQANARYMLHICKETREEIHRVRTGVKTDLSIYLNVVEMRT